MLSPSIDLRTVRSLRGLLSRLRRADKAANESGLALFKGPLVVSFVDFLGGHPSVIVQLCAYLTDRMRRGTSLKIVWATGGRGPSSEAVGLLVGLECRSFLRAQAKECGVEYTEIGDEVLNRSGRDLGVLFVPLSVFSLRDFDLDDDLYRATPKLQGSRAQSLAIQQITAGGFLTPVHLELFRISLFLELAWNSVLHANNRPGEGSCIFGARGRTVGKRSRRSFQWAIADSGRGIAAALGSASLDRPEIIGTLRRLGRPNTTSRPDFPSTHSREGNRGYKHIATVARENGSLSLLSSGVMLALTKRVDKQGDPVWTLTQDYGDSAPQGTLIWGEFQPVAVKQYYAGKGAFRSEWIESARYCSLVVTGSSESLGLGDLHRRLSVAVAGERLVIDFGFVESPVETILFVLKETLRRFPSSPPVLVHVSGTSNTLFQILADELRRAALVPVFPVCFIDHQGRLLELEISGQSHQVRLEELKVSDRGSRAGDQYNRVLTILKAVNSQYLAAGFESASASGEAGFFRADVQQFSGRLAGGYFALGLNTRSHESAKRRWSIGVAVAIQSLLANRRAPSRLRVVAFSAPVEHVAHAATQFVMSSYDLEAYLIRAYEPPSRAELQKKIDPGDSVVLLTDAMVSGIQLKGFASVVNRLGASVLGAVVVTDFSDEIQHWEFPVLSLAHVVLPEPTGGELLELDPVSLIPRNPPGVRRETVRRTLRALDVVRQSKAVLQGHFESGGRHATFFVSLSRLLSADPSHLVLDMLRERLDFVVQSLPNFIPNVTMQPVGLPGIARLGSALEDTEEDHAAALSRIRKAIEEVRPEWREVLSQPPLMMTRSYDSNGSLRCSVADDLNPSVTGKDVLVIDDGLSSGQTLRGMLEHLRSRGAKRVLVMAMLARAPIDDILWWESVRYVHSVENDCDVLLGFVFPLLIPVPFFRTDGCPWEEMASGVAKFASADGDLGTVAGKIRDEIEPRRLIEVKPTAEDFVRAATAIYWRGALELAVEDSETNALLQTKLEPNAAADWLALVSILCVEPRLMLRPRLRFWLPDRILSYALATLENSESSPSDRLNSLVLGRTAFPDQYNRVVDALARSADCPPELLERCAFQMISLDQASRSRAELIKSADTLKSTVSKILSTTIVARDKIEVYRRGYHLLDEATRKAKTNNVSSELNVPFHQALIDVLALLRQNRDYHRLSGILLTFSLAYQQSLTSTQVQYYQTQWEGWPARLRDELVPALAKLNSYMTATLDAIGSGPSQQSVVKFGGIEIAADELRFIADSDDMASHFSGAVSAVSFFLEISLATVRKRQGGESLRYLSQAAQQLRTHLLSKNSTIYRLGRSLVQLTLDDVANTLKHVLENEVPGSRVAVKFDRGIETAERERAVLMQESVLRAVSSAIATNITEAAMQTLAIGGKCDVVLITRRNGDGIVIEIWDSADQPGRKSRTSDHTKRLNDQLYYLSSSLETQYLSGSISPLCQSSIRAKQALRLTFAPDTLKLLCTP
jgi:adenine/guanine phosphoribosyltransferase-like PRPP-binding protein